MSSLEGIKEAESAKERRMHVLRMASGLLWVINVVSFLVLKYAGQTDTGYVVVFGTTFLQLVMRVADISRQLEKTNMLLAEIVRSQHSASQAEQPGSDTK